MTGRGKVDSYMFAVMASTVILISASTTASTTDEGHNDARNSVNIMIEFEHYKIAVGENAEFRCSSNSYESDELLWINENGTAIDTLNNTRYTDVNGVLTISDVILSDASEYTCATADGLYNETVELQVYVMPDYFFEGMVLLAVNGLLIVIFCVCLISTTVKQHHDSKKYREIKQKTIDTHLTSPAKDSNVNKKCDVV